MRLLHWSILKPNGDSKLTAIRFSNPVRIASLRLFPDGAKPFENIPEIVAETKPESFYLDLFFQQMKDGKPSFAPTRLAYSGGLLDFAVDMADEAETRLLIFKGDFEAISIAVYGELVSAPEQSSAGGMNQLPSTEPTRLSTPMDPANSQDPTLLAKQLLGLTPKQASLPVAIRLVFCLKPTEEEWASPEFPNLYADIGSLEEESDVQEIVQIMRRPIADDITDDALNDFTDKIAKSSHEDDYAFHIANLLSISASQHPGLTRAMLRKLESKSIFNAENLDQSTLLCLLDASTNVDVSRHLNDALFLETLQEIENNYKLERSAQVAAGRLSTRIQQWSSFEDALTNPEADFEEACGLLKEVAKEEQALGIWLESILTHADVLAKSLETPISATTQDVPSIRFHKPEIPFITHCSFLTLLRAFTGVASVLATWVWADELGHDPCRERALAVLHLWQTASGYREIVNYLLLQPLAIRRLKWIATEAPQPRRSSTLAEQILLRLCYDDPHAVLQKEVSDTLLALQLPLSSITDAELGILQKLAAVGSDGLPAAVDELLYKSDRPLSSRRLRVLRVALACVEEELGQPNGLWNIMKLFLFEEGNWHSPTLTECLVDVLTEVGEDLTAQFSLSPLLTMNQSLSDQLFSTAADLIGLLTKVLTSYLNEPHATLPLSSRGLRSLVNAVADVYCAADAALEIFSPNSPVRASAQSNLQGCLDLISILSGPDIFVDAGARRVLGAKVVLQTLLGRASHYGTHLASHSETRPVVERDPSRHLHQVYTLVDHILPMPPSTETESLEEASVVIEEEGDDAHSSIEPNYWITILPEMLEDVGAFFTILDPSKKLQLMKKLISLDQPNSVIGIGEWLLMEELNQLFDVFSLLSMPEANEAMTAVRQYHATLSLQLLHDLSAPSSLTLDWMKASLASAPDLGRALATCLLAALDANISSSKLFDLVSRLAEHANQASPELIPELRLAFTLHNLRAAPTSATPLIQQSIDTLQNIPDSTLSICTDTIRREIGRILAAYSEQGATATPDTAQSLFKLISWLTQQSNPIFTTLIGITAYAFQSLCATISTSLSPDDRTKLSGLRVKFTIDANSAEASPVQEPTELPSNLTLPLQQIQNLLEQRDAQVSSTPSTPPRQKAGMKTPDILGVIISPPTALLRAHPAATTGLTKTYLNNDFRQLRQTPSTRQNTSRLPSMHVDDFQVQETVATSPIIPIMGLPANPEMLAYPPMMDMEQL